jgi:ABC-type Fe3+-siderophore transport system permease subunit
VVLAALFLLSFCIARYGVPLKEMFRIFVSGFSDACDLDADDGSGRLKYTAARILLCCLVGASLSPPARAYQGVLQNPWPPGYTWAPPQGQVLARRSLSYVGAASFLITVSDF